MTGKNRSINIPLNSPLYPPPPYTCKNSKTIYFIYSARRGDIKGILPEPLKPTSDPKVCVMIRELNFPGTLGSYGETILNVLAQHKDQIGWYIAYIYCSSDKALASGREIWGAPKKFGTTEITKRGSFLRGSLKIGKKSLLRVSAKLETKAHPIDMVPIKGKEISNFCLKVIPNVTDGRPEVKQLISVERAGFRLREFWRCKGSINIMKADFLDPIYKLSPSGELRVFYGVSDYVLGYGKIIHDYL